VLALPGLGAPPPAPLYSGFLDAGPGAHFHYLFAEQEAGADGRRPDDGPLVLWLNGGPGASSMMGAFTELGPVILAADAPDGSPRLQLNPFAWTQAANMLFLESPTGVGFSWCDEMQQPGGVCANGDTSTAAQNLAALRSFLERFPEYKGRDFMIWGESYAGVYVPTLSLAVYKSDLELNLLGFGAGDPCTDDRTQTNAGRLDFNFEFAYRNGLLSQGLAQQLRRCAQEQAAASPEGGVDVEVWEGECRTAWRRYFIATSAGDGAGPPVKLPGYGFLDPYTAFGPNNTPYWKQFEVWANLPEVQAALHVEKAPGRPWTLFASHLNYTVEYQACAGAPTRYNTSMIPIYNELVGKVRNVVVFSGDVDPSVQMRGTENAVGGMDAAPLSGGSWRPWFHGTVPVPAPVLAAKSPYWGPQLSSHTDGVQLGGYVQDFEGGLSFCTIHGAGHMVPQYRPVAALHLFKRALAGRPLAPLLPEEDIASDSDADFFGDETTPGALSRWVESAEASGFTNRARRPRPASAT